MNAAASCIAPMFVPAHRPELFAKAAASAADAIILDLEDAVPADAKAAARAALGSLVTDKPVIVRINAVGTPFHAEDVAALGRIKIAAVMMPKAEEPGLCVALARQLRTPLIALVETACGIDAARDLARCSAVARLALGSVDLAADLGCEHDRLALAFARGALILASRIGRLPAPLDGVTTTFENDGSARDDALHARAMGFGGKMVIHPAQLEPVLAAFRPGADQIDWAERILASGDGAVAVNGMMVDEPLRKMARSLLHKAAAPAASKEKLQ